MSWRPYVKALREILQIAVVCLCADGQSNEAIGLTGYGISIQSDFLQRQFSGNISCSAGALD
jgi:hypothetical protein